MIAVTRAAVNAQVEFRSPTAAGSSPSSPAKALTICSLLRGAISLRCQIVLRAAGRPGDATHVSVQNRLDGTVLDRVDGGVNSEIEIDIGGGKTLVSVITRRSADALGLRTGEPVSALFDAGHVILDID